MDVLWQFLMPSQMLKILWYKISWQKANPTRKVLDCSTLIWNVLLSRNQNQQLESSPKKLQIQRMRQRFNKGDIGKIKFEHCDNQTTCSVFAEIRRMCECKKSELHRNGWKSNKNLFTREIYHQLLSIYHSPSHCSSRHFLFIFWKNWPTLKNFWLGFSSKFWSLFVDWRHQFNSLVFAFWTDRHYINRHYSFISYM